MNNSMENCKHKFEGPFTLVGEKWREKLHSYAFDLSAKKVWTCDECGLVTCKEPKQPEKQSESLKETVEQLTPKEDKQRFPQCPDNPYGDLHDYDEDGYCIFVATKGRLIRKELKCV